MWKFVCLLIIGVILREANAARKVDASQIVRRSLSKRSLDNQKRELNELLELTPGESLLPDRSLTTSRGSTKTRYHETYKGVPVFDTLVAADDVDQYDVAGQVIQGISDDLDDVTPEISEDQALEIAREAEGDDVSKNTFQNERAQLFVYMDGKNTARLVYEISYVSSSDSDIKRPFYIIDAKSGEVMDHWQGLDTAKMAGAGGNTKIGKYIYGTDYPHMAVTSNDGGRTCVLENTNVRVYHMNFGKYQPSNVYSVPCAQGAKDEINGAFSPAHDALYFGGVVFNMYKQWYNTAPLSFKLTMRVHYSRDYENAFWDGRAMTFGDGRYRFFPLVSLDVSAHEVSHGFTEQNSGLIYRDQSGGMNEAFSDMSGEAAENFMKGSNDWKMGYDIFKGSGSMRYMDDPPKDGRSIGHAKDYYSGIDVHWSSGVFNKAFYLLSTKPNWGIKKAFEIMIIANQIYWTRSSTFKQGACGVAKAAADKGYSVSDVSDAFAQVGVVCGDVVPTSGPPSSYKLENGVAKIVAGAKDSQTYYYYDNPGTGPLTIQTSGGTGDLDMYVKYGSPPTKDSYDYRPYKSGNNERVDLTKSIAGRYHVMLFGYNSYSGVSLLAKSSGGGGSCGGLKLCNGQEMTGLSGNKGQTVGGYSIDVPAGASNLKIETYGGSGDSDIFVKYGSPPSTSSYDYKTNVSGTSEHVSISSPKQGTYYIMLWGYQDFSNVRLKGSYSTSIEKRHVEKIIL